MILQKCLQEAYFGGQHPQEYGQAPPMINIELTYNVALCRKKALCGLMEKINDGMTVDIKPFFSCFVMWWIGNTGTILSFLSTEFCIMSK